LSNQTGWAVLAIFFVAGCGGSTTGGGIPTVVTSLEQTTDRTQADADLDAVAYAVVEPTLLVASSFGASGRLQIGKLESEDQVFGIARYHPDDGYVVSPILIDTVIYTGSVRAAHVSGVGEDASGSFSDGTSVILRGDLTLTVDYQGLSFSGTSNLPDGSTLTLEGDEISIDGVLAGTAQYSGSGITADLGGQVYINPNNQIPSAIGGAFAGNTLDEALIGVFAVDTF